MSTMKTEIQQIVNKLDTIKGDLDYIKKHLVDVDAVLTDDDIEALREADEDFKARKTKRL